MENSNFINIQGNNVGIVSGCFLIIKPGKAELIPFDLSNKSNAAGPTSEPSSLPSVVSTVDPIVDPTRTPTSVPSTEPTDEPSSMPSSTLTAAPTTGPIAISTKEPSSKPTSYPSLRPSTVLTRAPTTNPTPTRTSAPSTEPTDEPSFMPSATPTETLVPKQATSIPTFPPSEQNSIVINNPITNLPANKSFIDLENNVYIVSPNIAFTSNIVTIRTNNEMKGLIIIQNGTFSNFTIQFLNKNSTQPILQLPIPISELSLTELGLILDRRVLLNLNDTSQGEFACMITHAQLPIIYTATTCNLFSNITDAPPAHVVEAIKSVNPTSVPTPIPTAKEPIETPKKSILDFLNPPYNYIIGGAIIIAVLCSAAVILRSFYKRRSEIYDQEIDYTALEEGRLKIKPEVRKFLESESDSSRVFPIWPIGEDGIEIEVQSTSHNVFFVGNVNLEETIDNT